MGHSAKATRGGNKKRVNKHRQDAKREAQGGKSHAVSAKEALEVKKQLQQRSQAIAGQLRLQGNKQQPQTIVRMAPRATTPKPTQSQTQQQQQQQSSAPTSGAVPPQK